MADQTMLVEQLYVAYFSRPADVNGLAYWSGILNTDAAGLQRISGAFASSSEYQAMYGGKSHADVVSTVYAHLFGRVAEAAGVNYWADLLDKGAITVDNVVTQIAAGALSTDKFAYDAKVSVATTVTAHIDLPVEIQAYSGAHANALAATYITGVVDLNTAANAIDPSAIDNLISKMVLDASAPASSPAVVELVGAPPVHEGTF